MSLYQKYRPQEFDSLSGQDHVKKSLRNALKKGVVAHAYLFCGPRGTGKTTSARLIAKSLNCLNFNEELVSPCNECEICLSINNGSLIDVIEIDAASNRGIDEIRELKETIRFAPTIAKNKVYIIDEVHMLTNEAFNALLKTLEEPPENVYFILATTEVHKIPETIMSRCQRFDFRRISNTEIIDRLKFIAEQEKFEFEVEALEMIAIHSNGGLRDAISLLDQVATSDKITAEDTKKLLGSSGLDTIYGFIDCLLSGNDQEAFKIIQSLQEQGISTKQFEADVIKIAREKLHLAIEKNDLNQKSALIQMIQLWQEISDKFHNCAISELALEVLTVRFCNNLSGVIQPIAAVGGTSLEGADVGDTVDLDSSADSGVGVSKGKDSVQSFTPDVMSQNVSIPMKEPEIKPKKVSKKKEDLVEEVLELESGAVVEDVTAVDSGAVVEDVTPSKVSPTKISVEVSKIESDWKKIVGLITVPTLRMTLKNAKPRLISDSEIEVCAFSNFDFENLKKTENVAIIEKLLNDETGASIKVSIVKEVIKLKSLNEERAHAKIQAPAASQFINTQSQPEPEPAGFDVLDMFEGDLVD